MIKNLLSVAIVSASLLTVGCVSNETKATASSSIEAAKMEIAKAKKAGNIWNPTEGLLKKAEALAAKGEEAKAIELADQAKMQAITAQTQAEAQEGAGPSI